MESQKDKTRFQFQMAELRSKGYFTMEDGSRSNAVKQVKPVKKEEASDSKAKGSKTKI